MAGEALDRPGDMPLATDGQVPRACWEGTGLELGVEEMTVRAWRLPEKHWCWAVGRPLFAGLFVFAALAASACAPGATATPTATVKPVQPTATMVPMVSGLVVDGATKGAADAKVTVIEYTDYL